MRVFSTIGIYDAFPSKTWKYVKHYCRYYLSDSFKLNLIKIYSGFNIIFFVTFHFYSLKYSVKTCGIFRLLDHLQKLWFSHTYIEKKIYTRFYYRKKRYLARRNNSHWMRKYVINRQKHFSILLLKFPIIIYVILKSNTPLFYWFYYLFWRAQTIVFNYYRRYTDQINILYDLHYNLHSSEARLLCVYTRKYIMFLLFKAHTQSLYYIVLVSKSIETTHCVWQCERGMTVIKLKFDVCDSHTWFNSRLGNLWCYAPHRL